jgi:hypothetical protein
MMRYRILGAAIAITLVLLAGVFVVWRHEASYSNRSIWNYASNRWTTFWFGDLVERESRRLAGPSAINCGHASLGAPDRVNDCILKAAQQKDRAFWGRYTMPAKDAYREMALVGTADGRTYEVIWTEGPCVPPEDRFSQHECPQPRSLILTDPNGWDRGRLTCFSNRQ